MSIFNLNDIETVMVFGAHPDDEIIGPGGVIHRLSAAKKKVYVVTFTGGGTAANSPAEMEQMIAQRRDEMKATDDILGITYREFLQIPSQQVYAAVYAGTPLPTENKTVHHKLIELIRRYQPTVLFTHSEDNHRDHCAIHDITRQSVFQASESILGHLGEPFSVPLVLDYCVERELTGPNVVIEIGKDDLGAMISAIRTQVSQTRGDYLKHFEQMIHGRAELWGAKLFGADRYAQPFYLDPKAPLKG